ncbi:hypothetical protein RRG08_021113 [Elysia crispata]|uniref:Uncharacterized protein n=1 Tax=Elysia crispata TaxID=231223 RepID=A0AAE1DB08_9GAST|nr:hypothetical protein RRG08_021113 [Elysia crispata]
MDNIILSDHAKLSHDNHLKWSFPFMVQTVELKASGLVYGQLDSLSSAYGVLTKSTDEFVVKHTVTP